MNEKEQKKGGQKKGVVTLAVRSVEMAVRTAVWTAVGTASVTPPLM